MADIIVIKPSSGDSQASLFSGPDSSDKVIATVPAGTMLKVVNSSGNFYTVEYDNGMENVTNGGTGITGTIVANPYATMYDDNSKSNIIGKVNNGTGCEIIDDSNINMISIKAITTEGLLTGYVDAKFIYRDLEDDIAEDVPIMFRMTRTVDNDETESGDGNGDSSQNTGTVTASALNIRNGPGTTYDKVGVLRNGDSVTIYETKDNWHRIGTDQWVSGKHIQLTNGSNEKTGTVKVNDSGSTLNTRTGPGTSYTRVGSLPNGTEVTIHETKNGWHRITATKGNGDYEDVWVSGNYIVVDNSNSTANVSKTDAEQVSKSHEHWHDGLGIDENTYKDIFIYNESGYNVNDDYYRQLADKYAYALGTPPKYNMDIDIQYTDEITPGMGRVMNKTIFSHPTLLSICPGKVKMFPNLIGAEKDGAREALLRASLGNDSLKTKLENEKHGIFSGKLYKFEADTAEYSKYVNALCRASAIMMNIQDEIMPGTTTKLKSFDYSYWAVRKKYDPVAAAAADKDTSLFREFWPGLLRFGKRLVSVATDDTSYINFFLNSEAQVSESITNGTADSPLSGTFGAIEQAGQTLNYFTGGGFDAQDEEAINALKTIAESSGTTADGIANLLDNFIHGGRMILPKMVTTSDYSKQVECSMKFVSPYGDKLSIFLKCIVPICHLLAFSLPKQVSDNMHSYPFLIRCAQIGEFNIDLGIISSITITRGGSDNTSWSADQIATEWEVNLTILPLVDVLMMTSTTHPILFCKNEQLLDYLGNFCGFDALAYNLDTKFELATAFIKNIMTDIPARIENRISDALYNKLNPFFTEL